MNSCTCQMRLTGGAAKMGTTATQCTSTTSVAAAATGMAECSTTQIAQWSASRLTACVCVTCATDSMASTARHRNAVSTRMRECARLEVRLGLGSVVNTAYS